MESRLAIMLWALLPAVVWQLWKERGISSWPEVVSCKIIKKTGPLMCQKLGFITASNRAAKGLPYWQKNYSCVRVKLAEDGGKEESRLFPRNGRKLTPECQPLEIKGSKSAAVTLDCRCGGGNPNCSYVKDYEILGHITGLAVQTGMGWDPKSTKLSDQDSLWNQVSDYWVGSGAYLSVCRGSVLDQAVFRSKYEKSNPWCFKLVTPSQGSNPSFKAFYSSKKSRFQMVVSPMNLPLSFPLNFLGPQFLSLDIRSYNAEDGCGDHSRILKRGSQATIRDSPSDSKTESSESIPINKTGNSV